MSVWLTPDLKPFVGATYFPPEDQAGRPGFRTILNHISKQVGLSILKYCQSLMNLFAPKVPIGTRAIDLMQKWLTVILIFFCFSFKLALLNLFLSSKIKRIFYFEQG